MPNQFYVAPPDISQAADKFFAGYDSSRKRAGQSALARLMQGDIDNIDFTRAASIAAEAGDQEAALKYLQLGASQKKSRDELEASKNFNTSMLSVFGGANAGQAPAKPTSGQSVLEQLMNVPLPRPRPSGPVGEGDYGGTPARPGQGNLTGPGKTITGVEYGPIEGNPAMFNQPQRVAAAPSPVANDAGSGGPLPPTLNNPIRPVGMPPDQRQAQYQAPQAPQPAQQPLAPNSGFAINAQQIPALIAGASNPRLSQPQRELAQALLKQALDEGKLDPEQKGYALYLRQGGTLPWLDYQERLKRAGATAITNDMRGENAEAAAVGKAAGERAAEAMKAASVAPKTLQNLNRMEQMLQAVKTGKLEPGRMTISAWAKSFGLDDTVAERLGLDPKSVGTSQAISALSNELTVGNIGPGGLPANNFSNADRSFVEQIVPQLANDPEGNALIIEAKRRMVNLDIEKARAWQKFRRDSGNKKLGFDDFEADWNDDVARRDLFGDLRQKAAAMVSARGGSSDAQGGGQPAAPPGQGAKKAPNGNWYLPDPQRPGKYLQVQ